MRDGLHFNCWSSILFRNCPFGTMEWLEVGVPELFHHTTRDKNWWKMWVFKVYVTSTVLEGKLWTQKQNSDKIQYCSWKNQDSAVKLTWKKCHKLYIKPSIWQEITNKTSFIVSNFNLKLIYHLCNFTVWKCILSNYDISIWLPISSVKYYKGNNAVTN